MAQVGRAALLLLVTVFLCCCAGIASATPRRLRAVGSSVSRETVRQDLLSKCRESWRNATLDHFTFGKQGKDLPDTFLQRYFLCDHYWRPDDDGNSGPIFFYLGNEADVELYLNNTGLMWETAPDMGALIVFAEHRYYGKSLPFPAKDVRAHMHYLTAEQAMADYAGLIMEIKAHLAGAADSAVIGFGGSYGGMLGSWFRMKYPHLMDGVIAGSAPIWVFEGETPVCDPGFFAKGVTYDASEAGGSEAACVPNARQGWKTLQQLGASKEGRDTIRKSMNICSSATLDSPDDVRELRDWLAAAWDFMAMGNFPYPSGYILNGRGQLPAYPVRQACQHLKEQGLSDEALLAGVAAAAGIFYNYTGTLSCYNFREGVNPETADDSNQWDYQYCTEMFMPFAKDGVTDMFWSEPWNPDAVAENCQKTWGVTPRREWASLEWGGRRIQSHSNIVFSNGLLDPWHGGGVMRDVADTIVSLVIPEVRLVWTSHTLAQMCGTVHTLGRSQAASCCRWPQGAHHLDLMFSHPDDPQSVKEVREEEREWIRRWVQEARQYSAQPLHQLRYGGRRRPVSNPDSKNSASAGAGLAVAAINVGADHGGARAEQLGGEARQGGTSVGGDRWRAKAAGDGGVLDLGGTGNHQGLRDARLQLARRAAAKLLAAGKVVAADS